MTDPYETPEERRARRRARKTERGIEARDDAVIQDMLRGPGGRAWARELLERCHIFQPSYTGEAFSTAFKEGERNIGLYLLQAIMHAAPEAYIQMMKEANNGGSSNLDRYNPDDDRNWDSAGRWIGEGDEPSDDEYE
jgi:hypothetical protein